MQQKGFFPMTPFTFLPHYCRVVHNDNFCRGKKLPKTVADMSQRSDINHFQGSAQFSSSSFLDSHCLNTCQANE